MHQMKRRYAFHEAPKQGRQRILKEVRRLLRPGGVLAVIDISTEYTPSRSMLAGEPYGTSTFKNNMSLSRVN
jgi:ubiquinone/menaquinone biosynthesis C-methylase UbiE